MLSPLWYHRLVYYWQEKQHGVVVRLGYTVYHGPTGQQTKGVIRLTYLARSV